MTVHRAVVMAAGRGTRMQRVDSAASLNAEQERAAHAGAKAMMPVGQPLLDYVLSALADAGVNEVCIVVAHDDEAIRKRYASDLVLTRLRIEFAEQAEPLGTADAVSAARAFAGADPFLALNGDNYYSSSALRSVCRSDPPALAGYRANSLTRHGNVGPDRLRAYALIRSDAQGNLTEIFEKPDAATAATFDSDALVSMNLWSFTNVIFDACERVVPSPRGELELADAVRIAMSEFGAVFRIVPVDDGVLDLSGRGDIAPVTAMLAGVSVRL